MKARFSIYLAKDIKTGTDQVLNLERVKPPIRLDITDTDSYLYIKEETEPQIPEWASIFFAIKPDIPNNAFGKNSSTGAVLSVKYKGYHFLMPFGTGHHLINDMYIVQGFGLKVTLNSIGKDRIRSVDKSNHNETSLLTRNQSSKEVSIYNLKIDSELDFLTTLTGVCTEELLGDKVTGRDALVLTPDFELNKFASILHAIIDLYNKPLPNEFEWVNNIKQADQEEIQILDMILEERLIHKDLEGIWLGEPEIVDWEKQIGYCFHRGSRSPIYTTLFISNLLEHMAKRELNIENLKRQKIFSINEQYETISTWSAYRCIYAEINDGRSDYVLRNGVWYKANRDFIDSINNEIAKIEDYQHSALLPIYKFDYEADYLIDVCQQNNDFTLMDQKFIHHGGQYSRVEYCDLMKGPTTLIHVKYYTGSQSMSHLFSQAYISAELLIGDNIFRQKLNDKLSDSLKFADPNLRPVAKDFNIIFAIATKNKIPHGLPIFSKINLKNFYKSLSNFGFNVSICKIDVDDNIYKKKLQKPN